MKKVKKDTNCISCLFFIFIILGCYQPDNKNNDNEEKNNLCNTYQSITRHGITWSFDKEYTAGQFVNGDYWVVGPVTIISITNFYHNYGFSPVQGQDGSMINPGTDTSQGYDKSLTSYKIELNKSYPNGLPISNTNPLVLEINQSLVSSVSWLYDSSADTEPGCPAFNNGTKTPRPALKAASVLTSLAFIPPSGSFRPPYSGADKTVKYNETQIQADILKNLDPSGISQIPDSADMEADFERVWLDHVNDYLGSYVHPSENIPVKNGYGQYMSMKIGVAFLLLNLDYTKLPGFTSKKTLLNEMIQLGIDLTGIADNGGNWPSNGGHNMGRKIAIIFAGAMLNDTHMKSAGTWTTSFQEDDSTFYVSQADVDRTHTALWKPDLRYCTAVPYESSDIGLPEWGIRHLVKPLSDNKHWDATYRDINGSGYAGFVLAAQIMGFKSLWNHDALFDYEDRWWSLTGGTHNEQQIDDFTQSMWNRFRNDYKPVWIK